MIVDSEEEFFPEEVDKLADDVKNHGLSVFVFAGKWRVGGAGVGQREEECVRT